jgi:hypothetical protein
MQLSISMQWPLEQSWSALGPDHLRTIGENGAITKSLWCFARRPECYHWWIAIGYRR